MAAIIDNHLVALLGMALDAANMRQQAIAHNIANVNTPGFRRIAVSFEQQLAALDGGRRTSLAAPSLASLATIHPQFIAADAPGTDDPVALDQEVAQLAETTVHHQALLKALNHQFTLIGAAINEGKR